MDLLTLGQSSAAKIIVPTAWLEVQAGLEET